MNPLTIAAAQKLAPIYGVPIATILGVVEQESAGVVFATVDGQNEPVVRHEGHYLFKRLKGSKLDEAVRLKLASPKAGGIANPSSQQARWDRLLKPAMKLDRPAEIESCSWGVGQVMGAHWKKLGFSNAESFLTNARSGIEGQMNIMMRYCKEFGLIDELQRGDFLGFTRGYNGPGNVESYSASMRRKVEAWAKKFPPSARTSDVPASNLDGVPVVSVTRAKNAETMLRQGVKGPEVRELQTLLHRAGYAIEVDGDYGPATKKAVESLQAKMGVEVDGIAGPVTLKLLDAYRVDPSEPLGLVGPAEAVTETPAGRQGAAAAGVGTALTAAISPARSALEPLLGASGFIDTTYVVLTVGGVAVIVGGIAWAGYGWWKANRTTGLKGV